MGAPRRRHARGPRPALRPRAGSAAHPRRLRPPRAWEPVGGGRRAGAAADRGARDHGGPGALFPQVKADGAFTYNSPLEGTSDVPSHVALNGIREYGALVTAVRE